MNCDGNGQAFPKFPKFFRSFQCLYNISKKKVEMKLDFLHADLNAKSLHYLEKKLSDRVLFAWE